MTDFTCNQFNELMFDYIDGVLDADNVEKIETHIKNCAECRDELNKTKVLFDSVKDSRYTVNGELYAALLPQITFESKQMKMRDRFKRMRMFGSVGIAALIMIVMLVYYNPVSDIVNESTNLYDISYEEKQAVEEETYAAGDAATNDDIAGAVVEEAIPEIEAEADIMPKRAYSMMIPQTDEEVMMTYLNTYAPDYAEVTETLYIMYDDYDLPDQVVTSETVTETDYSMYVINQFTNATLAIDGVAATAEVYNTESVEVIKPYIVIITFN